MGLPPGSLKALGTWHARKLGGSWAGLLGDWPRREREEWAERGEGGVWVPEPLWSPAVHAELVMDSHLHTEKHTGHHDLLRRRHRRQAPQAKTSLAATAVASAMASAMPRQAVISCDDLHQLSRNARRAILLMVAW